MRIDPPSECAFVRIFFSSNDELFRETRVAPASKITLSRSDDLFILLGLSFIAIRRVLGKKVESDDVSETRASHEIVPSV